MRVKTTLKYTVSLLF